MNLFEVTLIKKGDEDICDMEVGDTISITSLDDLIAFLGRPKHSVMHSVWRLICEQNRFGHVRDYFGSQYMVRVSDNYEIERRDRSKLLIVVYDSNLNEIMQSCLYKSISEYTGIHYETIKHLVKRHKSGETMRVFKSPKFGEILIKIKEQ